MQRCFDWQPIWHHWPRRELPKERGRGFWAKGKSTCKQYCPATSQLSLLTGCSTPTHLQTQPVANWHTRRDQLGRFAGLSLGPHHRYLPQCGKCRRNSFRGMIHQETQDNALASELPKRRLKTEFPLIEFINKRAPSEPRGQSRDCLVSKSDAYFLVFCNMVACQMLGRVLLKEGLICHSKCCQSSWDGKMPAMTFLCRSCQRRLHHLLLLVPHHRPPQSQTSRQAQWTARLHLLHPCPLQGLLVRPTKPGQRSA